MTASAVLRDIFKARNEAWGPDDDGFTFERPDERIDVFVYRPKDGVAMTTLATIGMAARTMPGTEQRAELHLAARGTLTHDAERAMAVQLANLASHPFATNTAFDWGHMIGLPREFPGFAGCTAVFFAGPFTAKGWDYIDTCEGKVRILNVVPITEHERVRARHENPMDFFRELMEHVDIFTGRASA